jgi:MSHA biogenesis protein MshK
MDEVVKLTAFKTLLALAAACTLGSVGAQVLMDPTRPPPMPGKAGSNAGGSALAGPQLQSVLIGRQAGGRQVAVIDGETVRLGGTYHGAVLVRMTETEVELMRGTERQVLKLFAVASPKAAPAAKP